MEFNQHPWQYLDCLGVSFGTPLSNNFIRCHSFLSLHVSFDTKKCTGGTLSHPLFVDSMYISFIYLYILRTFTVFSFHMISQMALILAVSPHIPTPLSFSSLPSLFDLYLYCLFSVHFWFILVMISLYLFIHHRYQYIVLLFPLSSKYFLISLIIAPVTDRFLESNIDEVWNTWGNVPGIFLKWIHYEILYNQKK